MENNYIRNALEQYNMQDAEFELIRHNENMTLRVDGQYLLRIHKHAEGFLVKRPLVVDGNMFFTGFKEAEWAGKLL